MIKVLCSDCIMEKDCSLQYLSNASALPYVSSALNGCCFGGYDKKRCKNCHHPLMVLCQSVSGAILIVREYDPNRLSCIGNNGCERDKCAYVIACIELDCKLTNGEIYIRSQE